MRGGGDNTSPSLSTWADLYAHGLSLGLLPDQFWAMTFFELACYSQGRVNHDKLLWNHTSSLLSLMANVNRDSRRRPTPYVPNDFHPYASEEDTKENVNELTQEQINQIAQWHVNPSSQ